MSSLGELTWPWAVVPTGFLMSQRSQPAQRSEDAEDLGCVCRYYCLFRPLRSRSAAANGTPLRRRSTPPHHPSASVSPVAICHLSICRENPATLPPSRVIRPSEEKKTSPERSPPFDDDAGIDLTKIFESAFLRGKRSGSSSYQSGPFLLPSLATPLFFDCTYPGSKNQIRDSTTNPSETKVLLLLFDLIKPWSSSECLRRRQQQQQEQQWRLRCLPAPSRGGGGGCRRRPDPPRRRRF